MGNGHHIGTSRRKFIGGLGAAALAGPLPASLWAQEAASGSLPLGDAHVHLFNLADLPARGFFEHVVLWNTPLRGGLARSYWLAMLDLIEYLRGFCVTAAGEAEGQGREWSRENFNALAEARIRTMARQSRRFPGRGRTVPQVPLSAEQQWVRDSYYSLASTLAAWTSFDWHVQPGDAEQPDALSREDVARIECGSRLPAPARCAQAPREHRDLRLIGIARATLDWCRTMMQPRRVLLANYLEQTGRGTEQRPRTIVNLLVDYDCWLDDEPSQDGSGHIQQIGFWTAEARRARTQGVEIRTFAGFDPLKDVEERLKSPDAYPREGSLPRYAAFLDNKAAADTAAAPAHVIHGFKLYPPMGYRPIGNTADLILGEGRAAALVRARWESARWDTEAFGRLLDESLRSFYRLCEAKNAPLLVHSYHSNEAGPCRGAGANPSGWLPVLEEHRNLRLCIAHFASAGDFRRGMRHLDAPEAADPRIWPIRDTQRLLRLNRAGRSRVYADISYMSELLMWGGRSRARRFFQDLLAYCRVHDPDCRHFLFGTDWVLLAREWRHEGYASRVRAALDDARWPVEWQENLLHHNLQRFLGTG